MSVSMIDFSKLYAAGLPDPAVRFAGFPKYYFIGGNNDPEQIPVEGLVEAAASVLRREGHRLAIYNLGLGPMGYPPLRQFVADKSARHRGMTVPVDDVMILSGSNQGVEMISGMLVNRGDTILVEEYSYQGAINRFKKIGAKMEGMKLDGEGIVIEALAQQLADLKAKGIQPKFIYTIPTIQNPTATIMPLDRRLELIRLAREYNVVIFEDECYADLLWDGVEAPQSIYSLDPGCTIHLGSFSKCLAPAVRLGYVIAQWEVMSRLVAVKPDIGTGALDQMIVAEYFSKHFDSHVSHLNAVLKDKLDCMVEAVEREFGAHAECWMPKGGIFLWIRLPETVDTRKLLAPAAKESMVFNEGPAWAVSPDNSFNSLRLCFAMPDKQTIREGVVLLAKICYENTGIPPRSGNVTRT